MENKNPCTPYENYYSSLISTMKKNLLPITIVSVLINLVLVVIIKFQCCNTSSNEFSNKPSLADIKVRTDSAQAVLRKIITADLYFPTSYDPVSIHVDSVFYGPLTDSKCLDAAHALISGKNMLHDAEESYKEAVHSLKIFGSSGVFWHHAEEKKNAEERVKSLKENIAKNEKIIRERDSTHDGKFIGWQVSHRYRAQTQGGNIAFSNVLYVLNPEMTEWLFRYSIEDNDSHNLLNLQKIIRETLGFSLENEE